MSVADAIIVGAGPAGSTLAHALARAGVHVILVDRATFPRAKPCAEFLSPECSRVLSDLGVLERCESAPHAQLAGMLVRAPDGTVISGAYTPQNDARPFRPRALSIRRELFDTILVQRAAESGARVREQTKVSQLLRDDDGRVFGVRTLDPRGRSSELRARLVVGADGLRSVVARRLGVRHTARHPRRLGLVGHWEGVAGAGEFGEMHVERDGYFGLANVGGGVTNISVVVPTRHAGEISRGAAAFYERWLRARPQLAPRLERARRTGEVMVTGPFASRARRAWSPGVALVGDAADYFDPFTGEGIYSALRGSELLAPRLLAALEADAPDRQDALLMEYARALHAEMGPKRLVERAIALFVASPPLMNHAAAALTRRRDMADLLVGVCGAYVPPRHVLDPRYILRLLALPLVTRPAAGDRRHLDASRPSSR